MNDKDFFDEEYEKVKVEQQQSKPDAAWYAYEAKRPQAAATKSKSLSVTLLCFGVVLSIVFGWFLCAIVHSYSNDSVTDEQYLDDIYTYLTRECGLEITSAQWNGAINRVNDKQQSGQLEKEQILTTVLDYLYDDFYLDVSDKNVVDDATWEDAIAAAGTAILSGAGDRYSHLLTPQDYYDLLNPSSTVVTSQSGQIFGISYSVYEGVGLIVSDVIDNSSCFGRLEAGDIVLKMSNVKDAYGNPLSINGTDYSTIDCGKYTRSGIQLLMVYVQTATFTVLRSGELYTFDIERGSLAYPNESYEFDFVEFYFGDDCTNVSIVNMDKSAANTKDIRQLGNLPDGVGYIRLVEFSNNTSTDVVTEFEKALQLFKQKGCTRLILDLKGNPGGYVSAATKIVGKLICDDFLSDTEKTQVSGNGGKLLVTTLKPRSGKVNTQYANKGSYSTYFSAPTDGTTNIVVWTDSGSASASELVTGALLDYKVAVQMGTKTYGKGIAQTVQPLDFTGDVITNSGVKTTGNWAIYFTYANYYSPLGTNIHGKGYSPQSGFDNLDTYQKLWDKTIEYWGL